DLPWEGKAVFQKIDRDIAVLQRFYQGEVLNKGEYLIRYKRTKGSRFTRSNQWPEVAFGSQSFMFQEGHAKAYDQARYSIMRVAEDGTTLLIGLADKEGKEIKPL
ncbi:GDYXXLXY domain-containing protein, partial [Magnetococcales bacterium HHB-1]